MSWWTDIRNVAENTIGTGGMGATGAVLSGGNPLKNMYNNSAFTNAQDTGKRVGKLLNGTPPPTSSVDPFGQYRGQYINMLNGMMGVSRNAQGQIVNSPAGGAALLNQPGQQANINLTAEGINRQMNAQGFGNSGNAMYALSNAGNTAGTNAYNSQYQLLSALSGAQNFNPTAIASLQGQQASLNQSTLGGLGSLIGTAAGAIYGGPAGAAAGGAAGSAIGQLA